MASQTATLLQLMTAAVTVAVTAAALLSAATAAPTNASLNGPNCTRRCGDVDIPYPFGVETDCFLNDYFNITCDNDSKPLTGTLPVLNISLADGELRLMMFTARYCYNQTGSLIPEQSRSTELTLPIWRTSDTKNIFTAIGCDTLGAINVSTGNDSAASGCISQCSRISDVQDGNCSGIGCCQTSVPIGVGSNKIFLGAFEGHRSVWDFNPCSFAFVVEKGGFNFSRSYLQNFTEDRMPMVIDWGIGNSTCEVARRIDPSSYACGENSDCHDRGSGSGYICKCLQGYQGNPYLSDGCQDINECEFPNLNACIYKNRCSNKPVGNYTCRCPKGYRGDGRSDGEGCIADQSLVIQIVVGLVVSITGVLMISSWLYWIYRKRNLIKLKEKFFRQNGGLMLQQKLSNSRQERSTQELIRIFTSEELKQATDNYDKSRIVGRGGNGTVYRGILSNNQIVAVKKSNNLVDENQIEQFINEVAILSQINHRNVVKLLGCCLETQVPLLVYEFIANDTLFHHIHHSQIRSSDSSISWGIRLRISSETAGVLSYLHSAASVPIIHRDVKTTNILLDENFTAKVADFGASRLVPVDQNQLGTMVQGTLGYLDPEYLLTTQLTEKSDVYSFGVVLAELITGKKVLCLDRPEEERCLSNFFLSCLRNNRLNEIIDERIVMEGNVEEQIREVANLAKRCLRVKGEERPSMREVAMELDGLMMKNMEKKRPWENKRDLSHEEESVYLLGEISSDYNHEFGHGSDTTGGYDHSMAELHIEMPILNGGR